MEEKTDININSQEIVGTPIDSISHKKHLSPGGEKSGRLNVKSLYSN